MSAAPLPEQIPPLSGNDRDGREASMLSLGELVRLQGMELGAQDLRQVVVAVGEALAPRVRRWLRRKR